MKVCPVCSAVMDDDTLFCTSCGNRFSEAAPASQPVNNDATDSVFASPSPVSYTPVAPAPVQEPAAPIQEPVAPVQDAYIPPVAPVPPVNTAPMNYTTMPMTPPAAPVMAPVDPADHTAEFTAEDVSAHKVYALLVYIAGIIGIIPALLIGKDSPYLKFHVQQKMKMMVASTLVTLVGSVTSFLILPAIAVGIVAIIVFVLNLICFFKTASGKSVEVPLIKDIKLFK